MAVLYIKYIGNPSAVSRVYIGAVSPRGLITGLLFQYTKYYRCAIIAVPALGSKLYNASG